MLDYRRRVVPPDHHPNVFLLDAPHFPWRVDKFVGDIRQFGHVAADELSIRVEALGLRYRIENAEIRLRVAAGRGCPLPAAIVGREVKIVELVGKIALAEPPVDAQILA